MLNLMVQILILNGYEFRAQNVVQKQQIILLPILNQKYGLMFEFEVPFFFNHLVLIPFK